jgi:stress-induced-phosphoprotein 1
MFVNIQATEVRPEWAKGFARKGAALMGLERFLDAKDAYLEAFTLDPENVTYEAFAIK